MRRAFPVLLMETLLILLPVLRLGALEVKTYGFHRVLWNRYRASVFNPQSAGTDYLEFNKGLNCYLTQYAEMDQSLGFLRLRADLAGRVTREETWDATLRFPQLYLTLDTGNWVVLAGRSIQRWGTGFSYNPTDVIGPTRELSDPDNSERRAVGKDILMAEYFGRSFSAAVCLLGKLSWEDKLQFEKKRLAARLYGNIAGADLSLITLFEDGHTPFWGLNFAYVLGDRLEIHGEAGWRSGSERPRHLALEQGNVLFIQSPYETSFRNEKRPFGDYLVGFQYTFPSDLFWVFEYYHRDDGYTREEWQRLTEYARFLDQERQAGFSEAALGNLLWCFQLFSAQGAMRDYFMSHLQYPLSSRLDLQATVLLNGQDWSSVFIPEVSFRTGNSLSIYLRSFIFEGRADSEYGSFFQSGTIEGGIRIR